MADPRPDQRSAEAAAYRPWYWTRRWKRRRHAQLTAEPFCRMCLDLGVYTIATVADHITPHRGDPALFWRGDLQSLCQPHHDRDKQLIEMGLPLVGVDEDGWTTDPRALANGGTGTRSKAFEERRLPPDLRPSAIPLTIVCGPPGAGKSTYVRDHATDDDVVIDFDAIISEFAGQPEHHASNAWISPALDERNRRLRALHTDTRHRHAWFIVAAPDPTERKTWARRLGGELVLLRPDVRECLRRVRADPARAGLTRQMERAVRAWFLAAGGA